MKLKPLIITLAICIFLLIVVLVSIEGDTNTSQNTYNDKINNQNLDNTLDKLPVQDSINDNSEDKSSEDNLYKVTYIVDGDTFEIETGERVRIICIDTPEKGDYYYSEAKDYLESLILNQEVKLVIDTSNTDRYGRLLRYVYIDNDFVNELIVDNGFGKAYPYNPDTKLCPQIQEAEDNAKKNNLGIWKPQKETNSGSTNLPSGCQCSTDLDCADFSSQSSAQACFEYCLDEKGTDYHRLDRDDDMIACESL